MSWEASAKSLEKSFDYRFKNIQHLYVALTHKSFRYEAGEKHGQDNEKLEFLGDAVLDLVLSDLLMKAFAVSWARLTAPRIFTLRDNRTGAVASGAASPVASAFAGSVMVAGRGPRRRARRGASSRRGARVYRWG